MTQVLFAPIGDLFRPREGRQHALLAPSRGRSRVRFVQPLVLARVKKRSFLSMSRRRTISSARRRLVACWSEFAFQGDFPVRRVWDTYTSSGSGSPYIQGNTSYVPNDFSVLFTSPTSVFFFWLPGTAAAHSGGSIETYPASCPPQGCSPSWERIGSTFRPVASGSLAPVPEPGSGLLLGFGLATAGAVCLRRRVRDSRLGRKGVASSCPRK